MSLYFHALFLDRSPNPSLDFFKTQSIFCLFVKFIPPSFIPLELLSPYAHPLLAFRMALSLCLFVLHSPSNHTLWGGLFTCLLFIVTSTVHSKASHDVSWKMNTHSQYHMICRQIRAITLENECECYSNILVFFTPFLKVFFCFFPFFRFIYLIINS